MSFKIVKGASTMMASLLATSSLFAGSSSPDCCCVKPNNCKGVTLCHTQPDIDWNRFHFDLGFILEQARVTGASYAYSLSNTFGDSPDPLSNDQSIAIAVPKFNTSFGITSSLGYAFEHDNWNIDAGFDWLSTTGKKTIVDDFSSVIIPMGIYFHEMNDGEDITHAGQGITNYSITYYNLTLDLGRGTYITDCVSLNPHAGIKFAFLYDTITNEYSLGALAVGTEVLRVQNTDFWGVGPAFGVDSNWMLTEGWSIFMNTSASILLGYSTATDTLNNPGADDDIDTPDMFATTGELNVFSPNLRAILGLEYQRKIYCDQQMLTFRAGWDTTIYWNQLNHIDVVGGGSTQAAAGSLPSPYAVQENNTFGLTGFMLELGWSF